MDADQDGCIHNISQSYKLSHSLIRTLLDHRIHSMSITMEHSSSTMTQ